MPDAPHDTLREQVGYALRDKRIETGNGLLTPAQTLDAVAAVVAERERVLRERIEAIPTVRDGADSAAKYPRSAWDFRRNVLAVFDAS